MDFAMLSPYYEATRLRRSNRVELPGHVVGDAPEPTDIGLSDEHVGTALMAPVQEVDILPAFEGPWDVSLFGGADQQGQGGDRLIVGDIDEFRRRPPIDHHQTGAAEAEPPRLQIGQTHLLRQTLADLLPGLVGVA